MPDMTLDPKLVTPILFGALIAFAIYRRIRRNIGRQALRPVRLKVRIGILCVVAALMLLMSLRDPALSAALLSGLVGGVALALFGLRHTQFELTPQGRFYTPHTWIGAFVSALFLGRIAYRFIVLYATPHALAADASPFAGYQRSPLTLAIFGVLVGYYVAYYGGVLKRSRETELAPASTSGGPA